jgi:hypothetical protein
MSVSRIEFHRLRTEQCAAARAHKAAFWTWQCAGISRGRKTAALLETAENNPLFAQELPAFVAQIKRVFSLAEVRNYAVTIERAKRLSLPQRAAIRAISSISSRIH